MEDKWLAAVRFRSGYPAVTKAKSADPDANCGEKIKTWWSMRTDAKLQLQFVSLPYLKKNGIERFVQKSKRWQAAEGLLHPNQFKVFYWLPLFSRPDSMGVISVELTPVPVLRLFIWLLSGLNHEANVKIKVFAIAILFSKLLIPKLCCSLYCILSKCWAVWTLNWPKYTLNLNIVYEIPEE